jgi:hypothetical protein
MVLSLLSLLSLSAADSLRTVHNFNSDWKISESVRENRLGELPDFTSPQLDDSAWKQVTLPCSWNETEAFAKDIHDLSTGIVWYRKYFTLPADYENGKVFIEFEGVRQGGEFYVNGEYIGRHENGAMAAGFDITQLVKQAPAENLIAVRTDNSWNYHEVLTGSTFQWSDKNFNANYGGIPKNVKLHITGRLYQTLPLYSNLGTTGVYVYARDFDIPAGKARITAESQVRNEYAAAKTLEYEILLKELDGRLVKKFDVAKCTVSPGGTAVVSASANVEGLNFWSWGYGYLYDVETSLKVDGEIVDRVTTRTGFRKTEFADGMVKLNDRVIQVKGYAQRTSNEWPAVGISVPAWLSDFSNSLMVESNANLVRWMHITPSRQDVESCDRVGLMQAMPAGDAERDVTGRRWVQRKELMRDAIIYNRNSPSIIFYEGGNESISEEHMAELKSIRDKYDPFGGRASGCREMLDSEVAEYGGEMLYINKSADIPMWAMEYSRDEGLRKYWDEFSPPFHKDGAGPKRGTTPPEPYNHNQDTHAIEDIVRWYDYFEQRPGTGRRVSSGGVNIIFSDTNTHFRGEENYRRSGEVDPMRIPKDGFYAHQVMWDGWVDVEKPRAHIFGHWNYAPGTVKDIYVVSSAEKVELFINGASIGFGERSSGFLFTFKDVEWQSGSVSAVGYDSEGAEICSDKKVTAGAPAGIRLTPRISPLGLKADGADMALVEVEVVDSAGRRCPTALNMINFRLTGPAEWRGGIAQGEGNYILSKSLPVECGVNRVLIKTTTRAGEIKLEASSGGLAAAQLTLKSEAIEASGGLSEQLSGAGLPVRLGRGPTPKGPSYTVTRLPIEVAEATAGAKQENVSFATDDNELTQWTNSGKLSDAWIKLAFEEEKLVSEVVVKFGDWRRRSYPVRILAGQREVYKGNTPRSLGYCTFKFEPVHARSLVVELIGSSAEEDAFNLVEVTGKKDEAGAASGDSGAGGTLKIVEIEVYSPMQSEEI